MDGFVFGVTTFGYANPLAALLAVLALLVGFLLTAAFCLTIGLSVHRSIKKAGRERVRPDLRTELLDRLFDDTPRWDEWVAGLTAVEREVVESLLDEHLRELDGHEADRLGELGDQLGIPERARRRLETGDAYDCLEALTWLTLLDRPEPYLDSSFEPETPSERAAIVTLLQRTDSLPDAATGISILLDGIDAQFTVFGQDTLHRVARTDPAPLLRSASDAYDEWPEPLVVQVCAVCAHLETSVREGEFAWLIAVFETGDAATRAAAADALASFGWRDVMREQASLERAVRDPSPQVRAAIYGMLGSWGDQRALAALRSALVDEEDSRALTAGTTAFVEHEHRRETAPAVEFGRAYTWSVEHATYDRLARRADGAGVWN